MQESSHECKRRELNWWWKELIGEELTVVRGGVGVGGAERGIDDVG